MHILSPPPKDFMATENGFEGRIGVSLLIPARNSGHALEETVREAHSFFEFRYKDDFEIILIPNSAPGDTQDPSQQLSYDLAKKYQTVQVAPHQDLPGKGAALRTGLGRARGRIILFTDADLPYDLEFFERAILKLKEGYSLVSGNRRLGTSFFNVPVQLLPVAYSRHRLGLAFNWVVRLFFPIHTTDTQAGIKAMSRELARQAFLRAQCPGFFFDLEIFLTAQALGLKTIEQPVILFLNTEKSTIRLVREALLAGYWLTRIFYRQQTGSYS